MAAGLPPSKPSATAASNRARRTSTPLSTAITVSKMTIKLRLIVIALAAALPSFEAARLALVADDDLV